MTPPPDPGPEGEKLQKVLARVGVASRRLCEEMIAAGRVAVNGTTAVVGQRVDADHDRITLDGHPVPTRPDFVAYLLNKPKGVVTTAKDTHGRPTVLDLVPADGRVVPAGRLDIDTEGLIVLTNDGDLVHALTHPSHGVEKEYLVEVEGVPTRAALRRLREGVEIEPGVVTAPAKVSVTAEREGSAALQVVVHEGKKRQVRRMCEVVGHPVTRLVRTRIGPVTDPHLEPGAFRPLTGDEVRALFAASGGDSTGD